MRQRSADRIVADLRAWISSAAPGSQLPSTRELASTYGASPVTVQQAIRTLAGLGLVDSRPGAGTFVRGMRAARTLDFGWQTAALRSAPARPLSLSTPLRDAATDAIGLHAGYPARELLPERAVRAALIRAARNDAAVVRGPAGGDPELQSWFAGELATVMAAGVTPPAPRDVIVVPGSQSGLSSIFRALAAPGQAVIMESPTYWGAILAAHLAGVRIVPVASDADGPDPADLARAFDETDARLFYAQPDFANPTGVQWSRTRRDEVLRVIRERSAFLVEDDWAHDFGIDAGVIPMAAFDDAGHVIYIRSLTKSVSPALRVAAVIARGPARDRILADRGADAMYVSALLQAATLEVVLQPAWRTHRRALREQLRERRDALAAAVAAHLPDAVLQGLPQGGLNLWVRLPDEVDLDRFVRASEAAGVLVAAGSEWFPDGPPGAFLRLNYSGPDPARFDEACRVLGRVLDVERARGTTATLIYGE